MRMSYAIVVCLNLDLKFGDDKVHKSANHGCMHEKAITDCPKHKEICIYESMLNHFRVIAPITTNCTYVVHLQL